MNNIFYYKRRPIAEGGNSIGAWHHTMEFLAMVSIPTNLAAIYFAESGYGKKAASPVVMYLS